MKNLSFLIVLEAIVSVIISACADTTTPATPTDVQRAIAAVQATHLPNTATAKPPEPSKLIETPSSVLTPTLEITSSECLHRVTSSATPATGEPIALRSDIQLRKIITTPGNFIRLELDPVTNNLFYMDAEANIYQLHLQPPGTGATSMKVYGLSEIGGAPYTLGMAFGPDGALYIVGNDSQPYTTRAIIRKGSLNEAGERVWSTLASTVPYAMSNTFFDHRFSAIIVSPDGRYVYVSSGSRTDHGEVQSNQETFPDMRDLPLTAAIFRIPTDATDLVLVNEEAQLKAQGYLFAKGMRNAFDLAFAPNGELFAAENGPDADYPEELNWIRQDHHYGFPWRMGSYSNPQQFPDYNPAQDPWLIIDSIAAQLGTYYNDATFPPPPTQAFTDPILNLGPDGDHFRDIDGCERDASQLGQPLSTFTPHRVPLGLTFDVEGNLSEEFRNDAFILSFGPTYQSMTDRGQDLLHLEFTKLGDTYQMRATQLARGFNFPIDSVLVENSLYVLEYGLERSDGQGVGAIWEVTLP